MTSEKELEDLVPGPKQVVYTDGACRGNGTDLARASWGVWWGEGDVRSRGELVPEVGASNNVGELEGIRVALQDIDACAPTDDCFVIVTDSLYAINALEVWFDGWAARGWKTAGNKPVANLARLQAIHDHLQGLRARGTRVTFVHVRGHIGIVGNEAADTLATLALAGLAAC